MSDLARRLIDQETIKFDILGHVGVRITEFKGFDEVEKEDTFLYKLEVTDYVANTWEEIYPNLSYAILRAGVLAECIYKDSSFVDGDFSFSAFRFLKDTTEGQENESNNIV